jgi:hypothetical protein
MAVGVRLGRNVAGEDVADQIGSADENAHRAIGASDGVDRHDLAELLEELLALIQQVVGAVAGDEDALDLAVEVGNLLGQVVDRLDLVVDLGVDALGHEVQLSRVPVHLRGQCLGLLHERAAGGRRGRVGGHVLPGVPELGDRVAQPGVGGLGQDGLDLGQLLLAGIPLGLHAQLGLDLEVQEVVADPVDADDVDAGPDLAGQTAAVEGGVRVRRRRGEDDPLARVARRAGVGHVVGGRVEHLLGGAQGRGADVKAEERGAHGLCSPVHVGRAGSARVSRRRTLLLHPTAADQKPHEGGIDRPGLLDQVSVATGALGQPRPQGGYARDVEHRPVVVGQVGGQGVDFLHDLCCGGVGPLQGRAVMTGDSLRDAV